MLPRGDFADKIHSTIRICFCSVEEPTCLCSRWQGRWVRVETRCVASEGIRCIRIREGTWVNRVIWLRCGIGVHWWLLRSDGCRKYGEVWMDGCGLKDKVHQLRLPECVEIGIFLWGRRRQ
jgi:hypothetical protein